MKATKILAGAAAFAVSITMLTSAVLGANASDTEVTEPSAQAAVYDANAASKPPASVPDGWKTAVNGKKQYYINGSCAVGLKKIGSQTYFFDKAGYLCVNKWCQNGGDFYRANKNGVILKNQWLTVKKKKYYLDKKGIRMVGVQKIGSKRYYFNEKGVMKTGIVKDGKVTYYLDDKGVLEASKKKSQYYLADGKKMSKANSEDYKALLTARKILSKITSVKMSKKQKLKVCFDWVIKKPYVTRRKFKNTSDWPAVYANDHFKRGGGDCHADGAAFAYFARAIGYKKVYVCNDSKGYGHCWAEVNGKAYDPLFSEAKNYKKYYGASYSSYVLRPILHIAISPYLK